jgi:sugar transferase (PEP-CTERM system associated)
MSVFVLLLSEVVLTLSCYVLAAALVLDVDLYLFFVYDNGLLRALLAVGGIILGLYFTDLYTQVRVRSEVDLFWRLCEVMGIAFISQALLGYAFGRLTLPRLVMLYGSAFSLAGLFLWRILYGIIVVRRLGAQRVLLLGANPVNQEIAEHTAEHPETGLTIIGYVENIDADAPLRGGKLLGPIKDLRKIVETTRPDRIVVGVSERRARIPMQELLEMRFAGIQVEEAGTAFELVCGRISTHELRPAQLIFSGELGPKPLSVLFQSFYSFAIALAGTLLFAPLMLLAAVAVKLTSPGPVLFRQTRTGKGGKAFVLYKFRSMYASAEAATGPVWAAKDDPRVTLVGRFLRRFRLDELPQFFNVLLGDMSIVGPRPERPEFVQVLTEQIPYYRQRHCVKPGITGWAQINHKYGDSLEETIRKLEYDLYYIKNLSPSLDAYIIFQTIKTMVLARGAQ